MKKKTKGLKLFPKTFIYTLCLMLTIILISHLLVYSLMPVFYERKQGEILDNEVAQFIEIIQDTDVSQIEVLLMEFAFEWQADIGLLLSENQYSAEILNTGVLQHDDTFNDLQYSITINKTIGDDGNVKIILVSTSSIDASKYFLVQREFENGTITAVFSRQQVDDAVSVIIMILPITALICTILSVLFTLFYSRKLTRPIAQMSLVTERMQDLTNGLACTINTKDEMELLADNINDLYSKLLSTIKSLELEIEKVAESEKSKAEFLRAASHELKTPVTAVNAMLENMLLDIGKYKDHRLYLGKCKEMVEQLSNMIKEILDATKVQDFDIEPAETVSAAALVNRVLEPYGIIAKSKGINLDIDLCEDFSFSTSIKLFEKALSNVLSNAVSYTQSGDSLFVSLEHESIVIENQCAPIPDEHLKRIFEPFYRTDFGRGRESGGNGLGLYIVDTILRTLRINFSFEPLDDPDGMRFTIFLKEADTNSN